jgi:hypothetical protein
MLDIKFSRPSLCRILSSEMWHFVIRQKFIDVSEERTTHFLLVACLIYCNRFDHCQATVFKHEYRHEYKGNNVLYAVRAEKKHGDIESLLLGNAALNIHPQQWETVFSVESV